MNAPEEAFRATSVDRGRASSCGTAGPPLGPVPDYFRTRQAWSSSLTQPARSCHSQAASSPPFLGEDGTPRAQPAPLRAAPAGLPLLLPTAALQEH